MVLEFTNTPITFVYHANCNDGLSALGVGLYYIKKQLKRTDYSVIEGHYQVAISLDDFTGRNVIMLDFCYPRAVIEQILSVADSVTIIDHHVSAFEDLKGLSHPKLQYIYDVNRCGATLAWRCFFRETDTPLFLTYIEDRDLWRKQYVESEYQSLALRAKQLTADEFTGLVFDIIDEWLHADEQITHNRLVMTGQQYADYHHVLVNHIAASAYPSELENGVKVMKCNAPLAFASDLGDCLNQIFGVTVIYEQAKDCTKYSLRVANDCDFDGSAYAKSKGGGGHKKASGWRDFS